jgi:hypothetical protein
LLSEDENLFLKSRNIPKSAMESPLKLCAGLNPTSSKTTDPGAGPGP